MRNKSQFSILFVLAVFLTQFTPNAQAVTASEGSRQTILTALMGAGTGAISAEASGGKAGTGALVGAGTQLIGSVLLQLLSPSTSSSNQWSSQAVYASPSPDYSKSYTTFYSAQPSYSHVPAYNQAPVATPSYSHVPAYNQAPVATPSYSHVPAYNQAPVATPSFFSSTNSQADSSKQILKNGLMGAATGAIASEASNGKAGTGALVGAGTQVIGSALLDIFFQPSGTASNQYWTSSAPQHITQPSTKKIIRKYDSQGRVVSEEEFWV